MFTFQEECVVKYGTTNRGRLINGKFRPDYGEEFTSDDLYNLYAAMIRREEQIGAVGDIPDPRLNSALPS